MWSYLLEAETSIRSVVATSEVVVLKTEVEHRRLVGISVLLGNVVAGVEVDGMVQ